ncbi:UDP-glucose iridoid glucosyltransferase-like [Cucumis melo var. makuwa]|uniref:UDP-glucose iridoid glucosyltransferase-like n=1 Tax=Cucumis melo var. makuwa TaxID=1194695 RepID=A0A5D3BGP9_CUCMM|nr:UDP-glucose iridoid glucosyltransferase-like [Cucumis melo var. makuwa]
MEKTLEISKRRRLLLVPCPYQGHINPMLHLATYLYQNGFTITIAQTFFNSIDPNHHPDFTFVRLNDRLSNDLIVSLDVASVLLAINDNCKTSLEEVMANIVEDVVCVIHDEAMYFCEAVASGFGVRSLVVRTTSIAACISRRVVLQLHAEGCLPIIQGSMEDEVPNLHPLRFKDLPFSVHSDISKLEKIILKMYSITTSSAVIWNTIPWLEPSEFTQIKTKICNQVPIFPIGPVHKISPTSSSSSLLSEDSTCLSWLHKQPPNSVIYVSLGSIALLTNQELQEMAWGLANSNQPFLWVVRPGSIRGSDGTGFVLKEFQKKVGDRGCIVGWAPQREVLAHRAIGGFWSHCGWNSTLESLSEGVPMLCRPYSGDQRGNSRYISCVWRVGLTLEGHELNRNEVEKSVKKLMVEEEGRKMRERAMDFKRRIEDSLREGGSCSRNLKELVDFIISF